MSNAFLFEDPLECAIKRLHTRSRDDQLMEGGADQECGSIVTIIKETIL